MKTREEVSVQLEIVEDFIIENEQELESQDLSEWEKRDIKFENKLLEVERRILWWVLNND